MGDLVQNWKVTVLNLNAGIVFFTLEITVIVYSPILCFDCIVIQLRYLRQVLNSIVFSVKMWHNVPDLNKEFLMAGTLSEKHS